MFGKVTQIAVSTVPASKAIARNSGRLNRLFKARGLTPRTEAYGDKTRVNLWYEDWFVGRYELEAAQSASAQISTRQARISNNIASGAANELGSYRSLFSQVRELSKANKEDNELIGELALSGNFSNGQRNIRPR